jgi:hypothetical protein
MIVAVQVPEFLGSYLPMLKDVVNYDFGSPRLDSLQLLNELLGQISLLRLVLRIGQDESSKQRELQTGCNPGPVLFCKLW